MSDDNKTATTQAPSTGASEFSEQTIVKKKGQPHRFQKGEPRPAGAGRKKGTPNKYTSLKRAFLQAFEQQGGIQFLEKICETSKGRIAFMNNLARMLPHTGSVRLDKPISEMSDEELVELKEKFYRD